MVWRKHIRDQSLNQGGHWLCTSMQAMQWTIHKNSREVPQNSFPVPRLLMNSSMKIASMVVPWLSWASYEAIRRFAVRSSSNRHRQYWYWFLKDVLWLRKACVSWLFPYTRAPMRSCCFSMLKLKLFCGWMSLCFRLLQEMSWNEDVASREKAASFRHRCRCFTEHVFVTWVEQT